MSRFSTRRSVTARQERPVPGKLGRTMPGPVTVFPVHDAANGHKYQHTSIRHASVDFADPPKYRHDPGSVMNQAVRAVPCCRRSAVVVFTHCQGPVPSRPALPAAPFTALQPPCSTHEPVQITELYGLLAHHLSPCTIQQPSVCLSFSGVPPVPFGHHDSGKLQYQVQCALPYHAIHCTLI